MSITPFLTDGAFDPRDIHAMSMALDDVCKALNLEKGNPARQVIAERIITLARNGERSPTLLRNRVLREAGFDISGTANGNGATYGNGAKRWSGL
jgi:hypothetical protein